jgi:hypothetical protein
MNPHMTMNVLISFVVEIDATWRRVPTQQFSIISQFSYRKKLVIIFLSFLARRHWTHLLISVTILECTDLAEDVHYETHFLD